jgi:hypothetical protein
VTPCSPVEVCRCFGEKYFLHHQDFCMPLLVLSVLYWLCFLRCLFGLLFDPEDGGRMFLRNVREPLPDLRRQIPEGATRRCSSNLRECSKYENFAPQPCWCRTEEITNSDGDNKYAIIQPPLFFLIWVYFLQNSHYSTLSMRELQMSLHFIISSCLISLVLNSGGRNEC